MTLSNETIQELKQKLEVEKERLEKELGILGKPTGTPGDYETKFDDIGREWEENATEVEEYVDDLAVETNLEGQLKEVSEALARMEKGTYGICENCGKEIDIEHLRAYPATRTCTKCR
ncbi:MAG: hypothetical protein A3J63_03800 [Candidatus Moranbacteria bacterium RIFCSPHIGHO2_02_FULL_40_12b]|nr:MAG: hypothetical protein A3J63_03800 [Candidatus Moranbacteria bacterium RIFCSPHIGHO2_02_FULL_40_12b]OGI23788.1 MAG: hypothetical protein A3E91_00920 [Candidatus Moranbacteria bacterium RIFCSPHIGHO2_12_FULL_40_10]